MKYIIAVVMLLISSGLYAQGEEYRQKGKQAFNNGDIDEAIENYKIAAQEHNDYESYLYLSQCFLKRKEYDKVIYCCSEYINNGDDNNILPAAYFVRGLGYTRIGKLDEAMADLNKSIQITPTANAYALRGKNQFVHYKDLDAAQKDYEEALKLDPKNEISLGGVAEVAFAREDYPLAIKLARKMLMATPTDYAPFKIIIPAYKKMGNYTQVAECCIEMWQRYKDTDLIELIREYVDCTYPYIVEEISSRIENNPDELSWKVIRAEINMKARKWRLATNDLEVYEDEAYRQNNEEAAIIPISRLLICNKAMGEYKKALTYANKYVELERSSKSLTGRAKVYSGLNKMDSALVDLRSIPEEEPQDIYDKYTAAALIYMDNGNYQRCIDIINEIIEKFKGAYPYVHLMQADCYSALKQNRQAEKALKNAIKDNMVDEYYAMALASLGESEKAIAWYNTAKDKHYVDNETIYFIACIYARLGREDEALSLLDKAVKEGYRDMYKVEKDMSFFKYRENSQFKDILTKYSL